MEFFTKLDDRAAEQLAGGAHVNGAALKNGLSSTYDFRIETPGTSKFEAGARVVYLPVTKGTAKKFD